MIDEPAFQTLYDRTKLSLWHYIARITMDDALADDIFQEAYIRFIQSTMEMKDEAQMKSYLFQIATNCLRDHWRALKRTRKWIEDARELASGTNDPVELRHDLGKAMERLSLQQRSLLWLAYAEGYEHKEIAQILHLHEKSVRVLLFRAKRKLADIFKQWGLREDTK
jgi:RNA polymerase sigma-70 factor (ECF subfamily)